MTYRRNRLSLRIPWLIEAAAEGPFGMVLAILVLAARGFGWW